MLPHANFAPETLGIDQPRLWHSPIVALLGPRQCGKTTLARLIAEREPNTYFDLENPVDVRRLAAPMHALDALSGLIIIDEIQ
jgi:predicted AAA+ superfamily ATPase